MAILRPVQELTAAGVKVSDIEADALVALQAHMTKTYNAAASAFDFRDVSPLRDLTNAEARVAASGASASSFDADWSFAIGTTAGTVNSSASLQIGFPGVTNGTGPSVPQRYGFIFWGVIVLSESDDVRAIVWQSGKNNKDIWDLNKLLAYSPAHGAVWAKRNSPVPQSYVMYRPGEIMTIGIATPKQTVADVVRNRLILRGFVAEPAGRTITGVKAPQ